MSLQQIIDNITHNIQNRKGSENLLELLEMITRFPVTFSPIIDVAINDEMSNLEELDLEEGSEQLPVKSKCEGFLKPVKMDINLLNFLEEAELELYDPENPDSQLTLDDVIHKENITTRSSLGCLFTLYIRFNCTSQRQLFEATPLMLKYFGETMQKKGINPTEVRYAHLPTIIGAHVQKLELDESECEKIYQKHQLLNKIMRLHKVQ